MEGKGILSTDLWEDNEPRELWNARLFPVSTDPTKAMRVALSLQVEQTASLLKVEQTVSLLYNWKESTRLSLRQILESVDYERFLDNYSTLLKKVNLENLATTLTPKSNLSSEEILSWCVEAEDYNTAIKNTLTLIEQSEDILFQARLYKLLNNVLRKASEFRDLELAKIFLDADKLEDKAFELICEAVGRGIHYDELLSPKRIQIRSDEVVWVCAPARLDFAGGWSDTPPYCLEHGGSVLNAAVKLNGQYPIQVIGKIHPEPIIKINSIDLGEHIIVSEMSEMLSFSDPTDWSSLPKAAFAVTGIIPVTIDHFGRSDLQNILKELGGGVDLTLFSAVPAGSGLGTSSILGSAIIACLSRMLGQELTQEDLSPLSPFQRGAGGLFKGVRGLFNRTLYMEQLMTTGGGWQDQIGGVVGGVKHITTEPGLFQTPRISWTDLKVRPDMDLSERFLLYYTGLRRLAKNILKNIVGKYLDRDAVTIKTISQLREKSFEMKEVLDHRNIDTFGRNIAEVWKLNKTLDPGTSNEEIEAILSKISHLIHGAKLLGAGGGGFFFMVTKGISEAQKVKQILTDEPPNERARFFDFDVDVEGLKVSVL
jgi:galactokinase/mevalonate kinase-like predicted kinase